MKKIAIIEPTYGDNVHLPFNTGLLSTVAKAYESAEISFIGDPVQNKRIAAALPPIVRNRCTFHNLHVYADRDANPLNVSGRIYQLLKSAGKTILSADLVILSSVSGTALGAMQILLRPKTQSLQVFLHGNLNDLNGWRSRNPLRRMFDLTSSLKRAADSKAQFLVLEEHILAKALANFPWMTKNVRYFPHPQIDEEAITHGKKLEYPVKIGLVGISSPDKGFAEFCKLARTLKTRFPSKFEFHAIGKRHKSNLDSEFDILDRKPSEKQLDRDEYLREIDAMHFLFFWPVGEYYKYASSGIFYDGVNRKIPFLTNSSAQLFCSSIAGMGIVADGLDELVLKLLKIQGAHYDNFLTELENFRSAFAIDALAVKFRSLVNELSDDGTGSLQNVAGGSTAIFLSHDS